MMARTIVRPLKAWFRSSADPAPMATAKMTVAAVYRMVAPREL
jgi:hypothetical protein